MTIKKKVSIRTPKTKTTKYIALDKFRADVAGHYITAKKDDILVLTDSEASILKALIKEAK